MSIWNRLAKAAPKTGVQMGDQVLGHTPFKNPIYANRGADHPSYSGWNQADHSAAAKVHQARATELNAASQRAGGSLTLKRQAMQHTHFAMTHRQANPTRLAASQAYWLELAKSATVTTTRGMPIHHQPSEGVNQRIIQAAGPAGEHIRPSLAIGARPHYTAADHLDAADHHASAAQRATNSSDRHGHHMLSQAHSMASMGLLRHPGAANTMQRPSPAH